MSPTDQLPPDELEARLRAALHAAADPVEPDPAGWRRVQARLGRRRSVVRGTNLALAGAAAAVVAVVVVGVWPSGDAERVEFAPGATPPTAGSTVEGLPTGRPVTPTPGPDGGGTAPVPGGIIHTDGNSISASDALGSPRWIVAQGEGTSTVTDVVVRPGGTVDHFTMAYRYDGHLTRDGGCGDISWTRIDGRERPVAGGGLPGVDVFASGECLGAPTFSSDGAHLGWLVRRGDGAVGLQVLGWTDEGPADGTLTSFWGGAEDPLEALEGPVLVAWEWSEAAPGGDATGRLLVRGDDGEGPGLFELPVTRQADGAVAVPAAASPTRVVGPAGLQAIDAAGRFMLVTDGARVHVVVRGDGGGAVWDPTSTCAAGADVFLDAHGRTAIVGCADGGAELWTEGAPPVALPIAPASAALLGPPPTGAEGEEVSEVPSAPAPPPPPPPAPADAGGDVQEAPQAVLDTAAAIRQAAEARDWAAIDALIPDDGFTSNYGGEADHVAYYQREEADGVDVLGTLAALLAEPPATADGDIWVWPEAYLQEGYLGYRVGITADGTWLFYVAGD